MCLLRFVAFAKVLQHILHFNFFYLIVSKQFTWSFSRDVLAEVIEAFSCFLTVDWAFLGFIEEDDLSSSLDFIGFIFWGYSFDDFFSILVLKCWNEITIHSKISRFFTWPWFDRNQYLIPPWLAVRSTLKSALCLVRTSWMNLKHFEFIMVPFGSTVMLSNRLMLYKLNRRLPFSIRNTYRRLIKRLFGNERLRTLTS